MDADKKRKELDERWVDEMIDLMIGPHVAILYHKRPEAAIELKRLIKGAVKELHNTGDWPDTNEWVKAACDRAWELYNTYLTAKLMDMYDNGVPESPVILVPKAGSGIHKS